MTTETQIAAAPKTSNGSSKHAPPPAAQVVVDPLRAQFLKIRKEMNATFAEREKEIDGLLIALLAGEHVLLLGPAGTAKSALANTFCGAIQGAQFFQWLLTRFSTPEEIFGPVSLDGLKHDRFRRVTTGKLPECHVAFLDEIYKANSAVLNSLLTAINEKAFDNDGGRSKIPLETMVGASNELPEGPELAALHDRFLLRFWLSPTKTPEAFRRLLTGDEPSIQTSVSRGDLALAQAQVRALPVAANSVDELFKLRSEVGAEGVVASDRRWRKAMRILRASAWLEGAVEVTEETFPILAHVLWETTDQIPKLAKVVSKYTSAELSEAQEAADAVIELLSSLGAKGTDAYGQSLVSITREFKKASEKIGKLAAACPGGQSKLKIQSLLADVNARYSTLKKDAAEALGM